MKVIHHVSQIGAPPDRVYAEITTQEGLSGWWSTEVAAPGAEVGAVVEFTFQSGFNPEMEITELDEGRVLGWKCIGGHDPWADNTFRFELAPSEAKPGGTTLRFWQHYATELGDDAYGTYNYNWAYYLESLRLLCEEGEGRPFRPDAGS